MVMDAILRLLGIQERTVGERKRASQREERPYWIWLGAQRYMCSVCESTIEVTGEAAEQDWVPDECPGCHSRMEA